MSIRRIAAALPLLLTCTGVFSAETASAEWRSSGPFGGDVEIVRVVPKTPGMVVAGAHNGLIFASANGGASWNNIPFPGQLSGTLHSLEVDPRAEGTWYAGMEGERPWTSGVYKTTDGGGTWKLLPGTAGKAVWALTVWGANPDVIAAGTGDGIYLSEDAGKDWARISPPENEELRPVVSLAFHPDNKNILFAGTTHLPWRTTDGGATWESIHTGMIDDSDVFSIQVNARQPATVFASACSGLYRSSDSADHWSKLVIPKGAFRTWFVALHPRQDGVVFAGTTEGLLRSENEGRSWKLVTPEAVRSIAFDLNVPNRIFFASTSAGLMVSNDEGRTVHQSNFGFTNRNFTVLAGARGGVYASSVFEAGSGGIYKSDNLGLRWQKGGATLGQQVRLLTAAPDVAGLVFAAGYHGLLKSKDGGKVWTAVGSPPGARINSLLALPHDVLLAATDNQGVFRSRGGTGWEPVATGIAGAVTSLELSGGRNVSAIGPDGAFASLDSGATWKSCGEPATSSVWYGLAFEAGGTGTALAATSAGLFRSADECQTWTRVASGLQAATVSVVVFHPTKSGEAFAAQDGIIFKSADSGKTWEPMDDERTWPSALLVLPDSPTRLFVLLPRRGIASREINFGQ
ncbi:MAG: hypothetical protein M3N93_10060 [Acidobacteriota bacterium]|nr:hypothetical protein [Acidobacteriota bacterium]